MTRLVASLTLLAGVVALAGCSGGDERIEADSARRLVLQAEDVPREFERFDFGRTAQADLPAGARADPARFGREGGWKARYRRGTILELNERFPPDADLEAAWRRGLDALRP